MIIVCILSIVACVVSGTILLVQVMGDIARKLTIRHYDRYHNFNTIWWHIEHALDPFML